MEGSGEGKGPAAPVAGRGRARRRPTSSDASPSSRSVRTHSSTTAGMDNHRRFVSNSANDLNQYRIPPSLRAVISSVALVAVGDTAWASGILLNKNGLVLTNAHLLEPCRFGRTSPLRLQHKTTSLAGEKKQLQSQHCEMSNEDAVMHEVSFFNLGSKREKRIFVRLDDGEKQTWCSASVVFISKGGRLMLPCFKCERPRLNFVQVDQNLFVRQQGRLYMWLGMVLLDLDEVLCSSLSSAVVSKVVQIPPAQHSHLSSNVQTDSMDLPVMLQTTAAVHPGA